MITTRAPDGANKVSPLESLNNFTQALLVVLVTNIMSVHDPKLHKSSVYFILPQKRDWQSLCPYSFTVREEHSIHFFPVYFRAEEVELILILSIK